MKRKTIVTLVFIFCAWAMHAQAGALKIAAAESRDTGNLRGACIALRQALQTDPIDFETNYDLARNYSLLGIKDSACYFLYVSVSIRQDFDILTNPDFLNLIADERWKKIRYEIAAPYFLQYPRYDKETVLQLAALQLLDGAYTWHLQVQKSKHTPDPFLIRHYERLKDSINEVTRRELEEIVKTKGWPKASLVGRQGVETAFRIMQHAGPKEPAKSTEAILPEPVKKDKVLIDDSIPVRPFLKGGIIPYQIFARSSGIYFEQTLRKNFSIEFRMAYTFRQKSLEERYQYTLSVKGYFLYSGENAYLAWSGTVRNGMKFSMLVGQRYWEYCNEWMPQSAAAAPGPYLFHECKSSYLFGIGIGFGFSVDLARRSSFLDCEYFMNAFFMQCWIRDMYSNAEGPTAPPHPPDSYEIYPKHENRLTLQPVVALGFKLGLKKFR